jgi:hypothetical protein
MMLRIRELESTQTIGDLRQKIAELEVEVNTPSHFFFFKLSILILESRINHSWSFYR